MAAAQTGERGEIAKVEFAKDNNQLGVRIGVRAKAGQWTDLVLSQRTPCRHHHST